MATEGSFVLAAFAVRAAFLRFLGARGPWYRDTLCAAKKVDLNSPSGGLLGQRLETCCSVRNTSLLLAFVLCLRDKGSNNTSLTLHKDLAHDSSERELFMQPNVWVCACGCGVCSSLSLTRSVSNRSPLKGMVTAAASGQRERVRQLMPTALPRL